MLRLLVLTLFITTLISTPCQLIGETSDWGKAGRVLEAELESSKDFFPNSLNSTLWGAIQAFRSFGVHKGIFRQTKLPSKHFASGELPVMLHINKRHGKTIPSPLVIHMTGVGSNLHSNLTRRLRYFLVSRGYHVLTLPNAWSKDYVKEKPKYRAGSIFHEAIVGLDFAKYVKAKIGSKNITRMDLLGESYGGFIAAIMANYNQRLKNPIFDGQVSLLSPPMDMIFAFKNLDKHIDKSFHKLDPLCKGLVNSGKIARQHGKFFHSRKISKFANTCAGHLMIEWGFYSPLRSVADLSDKLYNLKKLPRWHFSRKRALKKMRYKTIFSEYLPRANYYLNKPGLSQLTYWIGNLNPEQREKTRVILAKDDFINDGLPQSQWDRLSHLLDADHLVLTPWGGHLGYLSRPEISPFLDQTFGPIDRARYNRFHHLRFLPLALR